MKEKSTFLEPDTRKSSYLIQKPAIDCELVTFLVVLRRNSPDTNSLGSSLALYYQCFLIHVARCEDSSTMLLPIHLTCSYGSLSISLNRSSASTNQNSARALLRVHDGELTVGNIWSPATFLRALHERCLKIHKLHKTKNNQNKEIC